MMKAPVLLQAAFIVALNLSSVSSVTTAHAQEQSSRRRLVGMGSDDDLFMNHAIIDEGGPVLLPFLAKTKHAIDRHENPPLEIQVETKFAFSRTAIESTSEAPSMSPTVNCMADDIGAFGSETEFVVDVEYKYELETTSGANLNDIYPALEKGISDSLLQVLFSFKCSLGRRSLRDGRRLTIVGLTPQPDDVILSDVSCSAALESPSNQCNVVDGKLSLFLDGSEGGERESALAVIRDHMSRNIYVNVHPDIVRVTYVDFVALRAGPAVQPSPQADGGKKGLAIYTYVLIAAGVLFLSVLALVLVRKRRKIPTHVDEEKSLANDYESPPAFPAIHG